MHKGKDYWNSECLTEISTMSAPSINKETPDIISLLAIAGCQVHTTDT